MLARSASSSWVPEPGLWLDLLEKMFARIDQLEEFADPDLAAMRAAVALRSDRQMVERLLRFKP